MMERRSISYENPRTNMIGSVFIKYIIKLFHPVYMRFRNAIQVKNIAGQQVGHIPRENASNLAPLLDQRLVTVEGVILEGNRTFHPSPY